MTRQQILRQFISNYISIEGRGLPSVIIIGAQKAGTTSLFAHLEKHPDVYSSFIKEPQYFCRRYAWGVRGYRAFFSRVEISKPRPIHILESSPDYLFLPEVPPRMFALLPQVKIIIMFREPVSRAYSHFQHNSRRGWEERGFEDAINEDIAKFKQYGVDPCPGETWRKYRDHSYFRRGVYVQQMDRWFSRFPRENIKLMRAEDFFSDPAAETRSVLKFLGLPELPIDTSRALNEGHYDRGILSKYESLGDLFATHNALLQERFGIGWED